MGRCDIRPDRRISVTPRDTEARPASLASRFTGDAQARQNVAVPTRSDSLDNALASLPRRYAGPGGAAAVLRDGQVVIRHAWGWANAEHRIPFTPRSLFRMCSITKQFTCAALLDAFPDPAVLDSDVAARLPLLAGVTPTARHLACNQSGLRDYWAVAMLHGSPAEASFGETEAARVIGGTRTLQFAPGTRYSYSNQNFRILSDILEHRTGRSFADLLRARVFAPAGMETAIVAADTRAMPDGTEGYEGSQAGGFRAAENRIFWTGDAGVGASLDDMIAWERWIDTTRDDPDGLFSRMTAPVTFTDGASAPYGFGLARSTEFGRAVVGHGGALRGWRSHRLHVPGERVSVVVVFNHMTDARQAALDLLAAALGHPAPEPNPTRDASPAPGRDPTEAPPPPGRDAEQEAKPAPDWTGAYLEPETGLAARIDAAPAGRVRLRFGHNAELLDVAADGSANGASGTRLSLDAGGVRMDRPQENMNTRLFPTAGLPGIAGLPGRYRCEELDTELTVVDAGGMLYGAFSGFIGAGRMELLDPVAAAVWALPCPRALDHTPPGDWTLAAHPAEGSEVARITVGCWLARGLIYQRAR